MKRLFALLLVFAMVLGLVPGVFAAEGEDLTIPLTEEDLFLADLMWEEINAVEASMTAKKAPLSNTVDAIIATVTDSPYYEEDSLIRNGNHFFWETTNGIACGYSPRLAALAQTGDIATEAPTAPATLTYSYGTKSGHPGAKDVYVIQPYYGIDSDFTTQYVTEAQNIAKALGGTATVYRTDNATIDTIADAMEQGGVVFFDSHGDTDYVNPSNENDFVSRANTSYICLQSNAGLTLNDMQKVSGPFGAYYHAYYGGSYGQMNYYCVDGTAIANHMEKSAPNNLLWTALCLGMATDGLHKPLMEKGVAVTYGYSQSVTFDYDYLWEEVFWEHMRDGYTVAEAIAYMKEIVGLWDWCHSSYYDTIEEARKEFCAFPIVVSDKDVYPGHGNVDALQTVYSTWTLTAGCPHDEVYFYPDQPATCYMEGNTAYYRCDTCGTYFADSSLDTCLTWEQIQIPMVNHDYTGTEFVTPPTCTAEGLISYTCIYCGTGYTQITSPALGHQYENGTCTFCGKQDLLENPFTDVGASDYYYTPVLWALNKNITTGTSATTFSPEKTCTRGQVVTFLWRACGSPEPAATENPFTDVSPNAYYYKAVLWAVEKGITTGVSKERFNPEGGCTRGQVVTFLWRSMGAPETGGANPFKDVTNKAYYYDAVLWALDNGVTTGTSNNAFGSDKVCTRAQIVTFIYRANGHPQVSELARKRAAFNYTRDWLIRLAEIAGLDSYSYPVKFESGALFGITYEPAEDCLRLLYSQGGVGGWLIIPSDFAEPYYFGFVYSNDRYGFAGEANIFPAQYKNGDAVKFSKHDFPAAILTDSEEMAGILLTMILSCATPIFENGGYSVADFGFTNFE